MKFRTGLLGVTVVTIAIAAAILGSWALSTDVTQKEVTTYNYLTEVTGLFSSSQSPEYIDYNPSSNYLGYYTDASTVADTKYFDGVDFTKSTKPNNYRINQKPLDSSTGTVNTPTLTNSINNPNIYFSWSTPTTATDGSGYVAHNDTATTVTLQSFIEALNLNSSYNLIILKSQDNYTDYDEPPSASGAYTLDMDLVFFSTEQMWVSGSNNSHTMNIATSQYIADMASYGVKSGNRLFLSCAIDLRSFTVNLYYDNDLQELAGLYSYTNVLISYGGTNSATGNAWDFNLDTVLDREYYQLPDTIYLDPTKGVELP